MNKNKLDIFICSYKKFNNPVHNEVYKILSVGNNTELQGENIIRDDTGDNISSMNGFFSELTGIYWVWKNYDIKDYVGFCHYRRYFNFLDNIPSEITNSDIILPKPMRFKYNIYDVYSIYHNSDDLNILKNLLINKYNFPENIINETFEQKYMFANNIFIMKKDLFFEYCEFIFGILFEYLKINNLNTIEDVKEMVSNNKIKYIKNYYPNNTIEYQSRIGGFFAERLLNLWLKTKSTLDIKICDLTITENKYNNINKKDFL